MIETFEEFIDRIRRTLPYIKTYTSEGSDGAHFLKPNPRIDNYWHQKELAGIGTIHDPFTYPCAAGISPYHGTLDIWFRLNKHFIKSRYISANDFIFRSSTSGLEIITLADIPTQEKFITLLAH